MYRCKCTAVNVPVQNLSKISSKKLCNLVSFAESFSIRTIKCRNPMKRSRTKYRLSLVKVKIEHLDSMLEDSGSMNKSLALSLK